MQALFFFFGVRGRLQVAAFASLKLSPPDSSITFVSLRFVWMFFCFSHVIFQHMLNGHIVHVSLDCAICIMYKDKCNTSINRYHLWTLRLKTVYRAANSLDCLRHGGDNINTHTLKMEQTYLHKYTHVSMLVCAQMKPCLWSFCTESMKQAWLLNRVFIHFGLW